MTGDAGALHCPNCGASAAPGDAACKYCHATLATVSCPSCFALMFKDEEDRLRSAQSVHQSGYGESRSWTFGDVQMLLNRITRK